MNLEQLIEYIKITVISLEQDLEGMSSEMDMLDPESKAFKDLGVYVRDASGNVRDSEVVLNDVIAALAQIENPAIRAAKATELLGKEAAKIDWTNVSAAKDIKFEEATKKIYVS